MTWKCERCGWEGEGAEGCGTHGCNPPEPQPQPTEGAYGFRRESNWFFPPTFVVCSECGEEHSPGFDRQCRRHP